MGAIQQSGRVVALKDGRTRRFRSKQERRRIVEETLKPGASVSLVARAHDVNANMVFKWRKQYHEGRLDIAPTPNTSSTLVPVKISDALPIVRRAPARRRLKAGRAGIIDIDLGHARVRIEGAADPDCVRAALEGLSR
jgi:transposase